MSLIGKGKKVIRNIPRKDVTDMSLYGYYDDYYKRESPVNTVKSGRVRMGITFTKKAKLIFPSHLVTKALIYEMAKVNDVITNIEKANVTSNEGWVIVEVTGTGNDLDKAFQWMADEGVIVQMMFENC